jgi:hypothetical protein
MPTKKVYFRMSTKFRTLPFFIIGLCCAYKSLAQTVYCTGLCYLCILNAVSAHNPLGRPSMTTDIQIDIVPTMEIVTVGF